MDDELIDSDGLSLGRKSVIPGEGFFVPDSLEEDVAEEEAAEALDGAGVAVVADPDPDGLACVAILRAAFGEAALVPAGPHDLDEGLEYVAEYAEPDARVFVCDLAPDEYDRVVEPLDGVIERASAVRWFDHHQWHDDVADAVRGAGVDLVIGESDEECTANVAVRALDAPLPDHLAELAAVTRDHDLWIKEDPRSDDLADYSFWTSAEEYVRIVQRFGADLPEPVLDLLAHRREEKNALIDRAVDRADFEEIGPWTVAVTYGRCSQNEVAEALRQQGADASVIVKPAGSASIRGSDGFERCHEVARQVEGGGHPKAAGCKPDVYDDMLDFAHHWVTRGAETKRAIIAAFEQLERERDEERTAAADEETATDE